MTWTQAGSAVVVVAHQFNPSVVSQLWLVRNNLVAEDEFLQGCFFTDIIVQVRSRRFHMLIVPEQLQFVPAVPREEEQALIVEKVGTIVQTLPHTPYRALGLNFNWHLIPQDGDIARVTRELFFEATSPLYQRFDSPDAHFGGYLSKNIHGFRLKLDVKPILVQEEEKQESRVQFAFNYHIDLGNDAARQIQDHLLHWNDVRREAEQIINTVEQRDHR